VLGQRAQSTNESPTTSGPATTSTNVIRIREVGNVVTPASVDARSGRCNARGSAGGSARRLPVLRALYTSAYRGSVVEHDSAPDVFVKTGREVFVSWTVSAAGGGQTTLLLDLVEWAYPNGRSGWDNEREVMLRPDGTIRSKAPTQRHRDVVAEEFPDPIEAIESGAMVEITREAFDAYWNAPEVKEPGMLKRSRSLVDGRR
jgi:hypothetical protein